MNKLTKVGVSALCGSLAAVAQAGDNDSIKVAPRLRGHYKGRSYNW